MNGAQDLASGDPNPETVSALLDEARWTFDEERVEGARLDTRLAVLTGFAGLILALVAPTFGSGPLGGSSEVFFYVFHSGALLLLALAALLSVSVLFRVRIFWLGDERPATSGGHVGVNDDVLGEFHGRLIGEPAIQVERRMIVTLVEGIKEQRARNRLRWARFRLGAFALVAALILVVAEAILVLFAF